MSELRTNIPLWQRENSDKKHLRSLSNKLQSFVISSASNLLRSLNSKLIFKSEKCWAHTVSDPVMTELYNVICICNRCVKYKMSTTYNITVHKSGVLRKYNI